MVCSPEATTTDAMHEKAVIEELNLENMRKVRAKAKVLTPKPFPSNVQKVWPQKSSLHLRS